MIKKTQFLIFSFVLLWQCTGYGQSILKPIPNFPFLQIESNVILFPGNQYSYNGLYHKLNTLLFTGKGQVSIVHIGASHIQADIISHRFRTNLLQMQPGLVTGRGFIFPYSIAKTNNPWNYKTSYTGKWTTVKSIQKDPKAELGLSGIAVFTSDSTATFTIEMRQHQFPSFEFHRIKILCTGDTTGVQPVLLYGNKKYACSHYDTLNHTYIFNLPINISAFTIGFKGFTHPGQTIGITGLILENDKPGIVYHSIGINGASVPSFLKCVNLERDLAQLKPDLIILAIGINDVNNSGFSAQNFENNYKELIQRILSVKSNVALLFSVNNDCYKKTGSTYIVNELNIPAREVFYKLATIYNGGIWDLFVIMGGKGSMAQWEEAGLAKKDKIHFTTQGYELLGDLFYNAFWQAYARSIQQKLKKNEH